MTTSAAPAVPAGVRAVRLVEDETTTWVAGIPPILTVISELLVKLLPVMVTVVPPAVGPFAGAMLETVGLGTVSVTLALAALPAASVAMAVIVADERPAMLTVA